VSFRPDLRWIAVARRDLDAARTPATAARPLAEIAAHHCQQAAEKLVKALPIREGVHPRPSHGIGRPFDMLAGTGRDVSAMRDLARLTEFAVLHRHPSDSPDEPPAPSAADIPVRISEIETLLSAVAPSGSP